MVRFEHIEYLLILLLVPVMIWMYVSIIHWKHKTIKKIGDEALVRQLIAHFSARRFRFKFYMVTGAVLLLCVGAANLQSAKEVETINRQGIDIVVAMDVSRSMLAEDMKPSRLERAKLLVNRLMDKVSNDRLGLVIFAGRAYMQMPLTADHGAAKLYVNNASPEAVPTQGTVIAEALRVSNSAFNTREKKYKTILLITDGEDHDQKALDQVKSLASEGVVLHCIGVGTTQGANILNPLTGEPKRDLEGNVVVSKLNEKQLRQLAEHTGGIYEQLNDIYRVAENLVAQFNSMEQKTIQDESLMNFRSFYQWFLGLALVLLIAEIFVSEKKRKVQPA